MNKWEKVKKLRSLEILGEAPQEASQNLQAPETAPYDKRLTGRTKPLSLKAKPEFHRELKRMATDENCLMIEILEKALEVYKKSMLAEATKSKISPKIKQKSFAKSTQAQLNPHSHQDFTCDNCQKKFHNETAYSPTQGSSFLAETYCANCVETEGEEFCSFIDIINKKVCLNPLFDKKKQLCRSHNKQVWKRFHEFLKDMSVSSTAAWYETWDQSGDWKYFWNLAKEESKNSNKKNQLPS
jgi:hypothetical protein